MASCKELIFSATLLDARFCRKGGGLGACRHTSYLTDSIKVQIQWDSNVIAPIFEDRSEREGPLMNDFRYPGNLYKKKKPICCELMAAD